MRMSTEILTKEVVKEVVKEETERVAAMETVTKETEEMFKFVVLAPSSSTFSFVTLPAMRVVVVSFPLGLWPSVLCWRRRTL